MQIRFSQLQDRLNKATDSVLLVSGDEPYQHMLAADEFRTLAKDSGFSERKVFTVETGFDWSELESAQSNLSLFGDRTLVELKIPTGKPGATGSKAIIHFLESMHEDVMFLVLVPRLDRSVMNSAWVKAINQSGVVLRIWSLNVLETKNWIKRKISSLGCSASTEAIDLITQQVEGNLLAAMQEIEKIALVSDSKHFDEETINSALTNNSHYSLNELMDAVSKKNLSRVIRILQRLKNEDIAPPLLLWGITEYARSLSESDKYSSAGNENLRGLVEGHQKVFDLESPHKKSNVVNLLKQCAWTDRVIKGRGNSSAWHELVQLSLATQTTS